MSSAFCSSEFFQVGQENGDIVLKKNGKKIRHIKSPLSFDHPWFHLIETPDRKPLIWITHDSINHHGRQFYTGRPAPLFLWDLEINKIKKIDSILYDNNSHPFRMMSGIGVIFYRRDQYSGDLQSFLLKYTVDRKPKTISLEPPKEKNYNLRAWETADQKIVISSFKIFSNFSEIMLKWYDSKTGKEIRSINLFDFNHSKTGDPLGEDYEINGFHQTTETDFFISLQFQKNNKSKIFYFHKGTFQDVTPNLMPRFIRFLPSDTALPRFIGANQNITRTSPPIINKIDLLKEHHPNVIQSFGLETEGFPFLKEELYAKPIDQKQKLFLENLYKKNNLNPKSPYLNTEVLKRIGSEFTAELSGVDDELLEKYLGIKRIKSTTQYTYFPVKEKEFLLDTLVRIWTPITCDALFLLHSHTLPEKVK